MLSPHATDPTPNTLYPYISRTYPAFARVVDRVADYFGVPIGRAEWHDLWEGHTAKAINPKWLTTGKPLTVRFGARIVFVTGWGWELGVVYVDHLDSWIWHERGNTEGEPQRSQLEGLAKRLGLGAERAEDLRKREMWPHRSTAGVPGVAKVEQGKHLAPREELEPERERSVVDAWTKGLTQADFARNAGRSRKRNAA